MKSFAVVDIETTGLVHQGHAITEVAVVHVNGTSVSTAFHSLFDPGRVVPAAVRYLTGIDNGLTTGAPLFADKAQEILNALEGHIFVAHQVNFDFTFLKQAFEQCGRVMNVPRLCTMRLAKRALPNLKSASLKAVCHALDVQNNSPHRALGDALATAEILIKLSSMDEGRHLEAALQRSNRASLLPAQLAPEVLDHLPELPGVYYFFDQARKPIYIGKAINIKKRVISHFTSLGGSRRRQLFQREVSEIKFRTASSEYMALLIEDDEIRRHLPRYNVAQKRLGRSYAVRLFMVRSGLCKIGVVRSTGHPDELAVFTAPAAARAWMVTQVQDHGFSPERASLKYMEQENLEQDATLEGQRFKNFVQAQQSNLQAPCALIEPEVEGMHSFVITQGDCYRGFGRIPIKDVKASINHFNLALQVAPDTAVARAVVRRMQADESIKKMVLQ
jgi:DNA polymerase-3 subunit epsilon